MTNVQFGFTSHCCFQYAVQHSPTMSLVLINNLKDSPRQVSQVKLVRAQARAVITELKKDA